ncbi:DUF2061 domain-containing protein [Azospirillum sp. ST 5-10]|uniref:DUF2061 domain-containing protein n=1 Tax=unclassified Azospirillum TaxID=2630922 RepID=UPI003F4A24F5
MTVAHAAAGVLLAVAAVTAPGPARAEASAAPPAVDRTLAKTLTYLGLSALNNFAFGALRYGDLASGGVFALVSITTEPVVYYVHEAAWAALLPHTGLSERDAVPAKTASYTVVNAARVLANGWVLTGSATAAVGFLVFNVIGDSVSYAVNDLAWAHLFPAP